LRGPVIPPLLGGKQTLGELPENDAHAPSETSVEIQFAGAKLFSALLECPAESNIPAVKRGADAVADTHHCSWFRESEAIETISPIIRGWELQHSRVTSFPLFDREHGCSFPPVDGADWEENCV
jgi:hypothetical protein